MRHNLIATVVISFLAVAGPEAGDAAIDRETLKGLQAVNVVVESFDADIQNGGLEQSLVRTDVELRLRQSGVRVSAGATEMLYVSINALKTSGGFAYDVDLELVQPVTIRRTNALFINATTWSKGMIGTSGADRFPANVRESVRDLVDGFLNALLSVNPKP